MTRVVVTYDDLTAGMQYASSGQFLDASARVSRATGTVYWISDENDDIEDLPEDIDDDELHIDIPNQFDLGLGKRLVMRFARSEISEHYDRVESIFRRRGAYRRFKDFLGDIDKLDAWYRFEQSAIRDTLCEWARREGFEVKGVPEDNAA